MFTQQPPYIIYYTYTTYYALCDTHCNKIHTMWNIYCIIACTVSHIACRKRCILTTCTELSTYTYIFIHIHIYTYIYMHHVSSTLQHQRLIAHGNTDSEYNRLCRIYKTLPTPYYTTSFAYHVHYTKMCLVCIVYHM